MRFLENMIPAAKKFIRIVSDYLLAEDRKIDFNTDTKPPNSNRPILLIAANANTAAIADGYDALTTSRPYGEARRPLNALPLMKDEMTGHFGQKRFEEFILFLGRRPA